MLRRQVLVTGFRWFVALAVLLVLLLPWLRAWHDWWGLRLVDWVLSMQCHRIAERTWRFGDTYMAVCSRCTGLYVGFGLGVALQRPRWSFPFTVRWSVIAMVVLTLEAVAEMFGLIGIWHPLRTATGLAVSWPIMALATRRLVAWSQHCRRGRWG